MIPKRIHYCWFGRNEKSKLTLKCIKNWKRKCPDYEIIEWNEDNFDILSCPLYVRQAYEEKKWAFVTDYVRLKVVYTHGGIYLDTDVELRKSLDVLLTQEAYFGFENKEYVASGLGFGAVKGLDVLQEMMDEYNDKSFVLPDGSYDLTPCPQRNTEVLLKHGLIQNNSRQILDANILILPSDILCPIDYCTGNKKITRDTISIHHFAASWHTEEEKKVYKEKRKLNRKHNFIHFPNRMLMRVLGESKYEKFKLWLKN